MEKTNYAKCSNPRCHCFLCKGDYDTMAKNTYVAEPADPNRDDDTSDEEWRGFMRKHREEVALLKPLTQRQHLLYKYNNSVAQGGKDERDKKVLISQGLAAMNVAEDTATEKQKKEALEMDDVGVICPCCGGVAVMRILKPASSGRVTMSIAEAPQRQPGGFARGGHDYDDDIYEKQLQQVLQESFQLSRPLPSGQGAAVRRQGQGAAAAAHEPEDFAFSNALSASRQETETPIQQIHRELNRRGIQVLEEDVRRIFQRMSGIYPENDYHAKRETEKYFVDAAARNPPPPPPQVQIQQLPGPPPLPPLPPGWQSLQNPDGVQFYVGPNEQATIDFPWDELYKAYPGRYRGGKKSKIIKSRRGKKSKIIKSRRGKKSKMTKSRRGKKSKMTRRKV
jgi:hypothetical protein